MKRILILGVNGFIGHHLSRRILADTDWEVYGMDMQSDRVEELMGEPRFKFFEGDITINKDNSGLPPSACALSSAKFSEPPSLPPSVAPWRNDTACACLC